MIHVLFKKSNKQGTTGISLTKIRKDLREFCPRMYGHGVRVCKNLYNGFGIKTVALNVGNYSLRLYKEI